jgi:hypothetical protein
MTAPADEAAPIAASGKRIIIRASRTAIMGEDLSPLADLPPRRTWLGVQRRQPVRRFDNRCLALGGLSPWAALGGETNRSGMAIDASHVRRHLRPVTGPRRRSSSRTAAAGVFDHPGIWTTHACGRLRAGGGVIQMNIFLPLKQTPSGSVSPART